MTEPMDKIIATFETLTFKEQTELLNELRRRKEAHWDQEKRAVREIEVLGGFDRMYDDEEGVHRSLPPKDVAIVRTFHAREQIRDYFKTLPDEEIVWRYRFIQYRYLEDQSIWQIFTNAHVERNSHPSASRIENSTVVAFPDA